MADSTKASSARGTRVKISDEQREFIGRAIIEGLITPTGFSFTNPIATEGGDYNQTNPGDYNQGGGGNHNQGGGNYNQHAVSRFDHLDVLDITNVLNTIGRGKVG